MLTFSTPFRSALLVALLFGLLTGCMSAEQKMILKVDGLMAEQRWDDALSYLERYLGKNSDSFVGWRYRVLIRLEQEERASEERRRVYRHA